MPGFGARVAYAFRCFFSLLFTGTIAPDILAAVSPTAPAVVPPATPAPPAQVAEDPGDRAVQLLAILQRDGRHVDFLQEDLSAYPDAQVGTAVRDVHANCRQALARYLSIEPILTDEEGQRTVLGTPVDAATVRVVGNVAPQGSTRGIVRHRGWRVGRLGLPPLPAESSRAVVAPAEVEAE